MGKQIVICEVEHIARGRGFRPIGCDDGTWIDPRHVIDGDRLRYGYPEKGIIYWNWDYQGWTECKTAFGERCLILDPPKPEGGLCDWIAFGEALDDALNKWNGGEGIGYLVKVIRDQRPRKP